MHLNSAVSNTVTLAVKQGLNFLKTNQSSDGSFVVKASAAADDFSSYRRHPSVFFSALILECLHGIEDTKTITTQLANFLLANKSEHWTWNYWMRGVDATVSQTYPDDLDDTVCALAALQHYQPQLIDGTVLGVFAQALTACETAVGGPYQTWLINHQVYPVWEDVDVAVNANIGYFLSLRSVRLPGLEKYLDDSLDRDLLKSSYYCGEIPTIYFLSRWYKGVAQDRLKAKIIEQINECSQLSAMMLSLVISSALRTGFSRRTITPLISRLLAMQIDDHWEAAALYGEPAIAGIAYYAGSEALTTAFAIEALTAFQASGSATKTHKTISVDRVLLRQLSKARQQLPDSDLGTAYDRFVSSVLTHDSDMQVSGMSSLTAQALGIKLPLKALAALNLASLNGWVAYTIYDNLLDGEPVQDLIGVANFALRQVSAQFATALPEHSAFQKLVGKTLNTVDAANSWELRHARAVVTGTTITITALPDYNNYDQLAARSWGHMLAACGTLCLAGYVLNCTGQAALRQFFRHYLIARQLNDDAHDWEEDLRQGQLSSVVCLLISAATVITLPNDLEALRLKFWEQIIDTVTDLITQHCQLAKQALENCPFADTTIYQSWLNAIEQATESALAQRHDTQNFIIAYSR
jgi:hypothetical protein